MLGPLLASFQCVSSTQPFCLAERMVLEILSVNSSDTLAVTVEIIQPLPTTPEIKAGVSNSVPPVMAHKPCSPVISSALTAFSMGAVPSLHIVSSFAPSDLHLFFHSCPIALPDARSPLSSAPDFVCCTRFSFVTS